MERGECPLIPLFFAGLVIEFDAWCSCSSFSKWLGSQSGNCETIYQFGRPMCLSKIQMENRASSALFLHLILHLQVAG